MDRVLVLGGSGMLGHKVAQILSTQLEVWATVRGSERLLAATGIIRPEKIIPYVRAEQFDTIIRAFRVVRPKIVINCVGIVKQLAEAKLSIPSIEVNALFPQRLYDLAGAAGARVIHVSTDCVFSGDRGHYREKDFPDAGDLYGRTKYLGEIVGEGAVTLRTSIIGRALHGAEGLVEWFVGQRGRTVKGYSESIFSGVTTQTLAEVMRDIVIPKPNLCGLYQVAAAPISKRDLLMRLRTALNLPIEIVADAGPRCNRSLDASLFRSATGWSPPEWDAMLLCLAQEMEQYETWRLNYVTGK